MSYDINNYAFLGVPLATFIENLPEEAMVYLEPDETLVLLDEKFESALGKLPEKIREWECCNLEKLISEGPKEIMSRSYTGPTTCINLALMAAAGVSPEVITKFHEFGEEGKVDLMPCDIDVLPSAFCRVVHKREGELRGAVKVEGLLGDLAKVCLNCIETSETDDDYNDVPLLSFNLSEALKNLMDHLEDGCDMWVEQLCAKLIRLYLKPHEEYVDEEDQWTWDIGVTSTRYGDVHNSGGMETGELYIAVEGEMQSYDEEGWDDPRKSYPVTLAKMKEMLFGPDSTIEFEKYTPKFGG